MASKAPRNGAPAKPTTRKDSEQQLPSTHDEAIEHLIQTGIISETTHEGEREWLTELSEGLGTYATKILNTDSLQHRKTYAAIAAILSKLNNQQTKTNEEWKNSVMDAVSTATEDLKKAVVEELSKAKEEMKGELRANMEKIEQTQSSQPRQTSSMTPPTWSDIVASTAATKANPHVAARAAIAARQVKVTLEGDSGALRIEMDGKELKEAFQRKVEELGSNGKVREIRKSVKDKTLLIEMRTDEDATELRQNILTETFTKALGIRYLPRKYALIVKFVPVTCTIEKEKHAIFEENNVDPDNVHEFRWMKPEGRRAETQKVAHALLTLKDENTANDLVARGMYIHSQFTKVERLRHEPMRCNKCQMYGHMARECKQTKEICAYCGETHSSRTCTNAATSFCRPCNTKGHTATSRECPTFLRKCEEYNERNPINALPYFPTAAPWTWSSGPDTNHYRRSQMGTLADAIVKGKEAKNKKNANKDKSSWSDDDELQIIVTAEGGEKQGSPEPTQ